MQLKSGSVTELVTVCMFQLSRVFGKYTVFHLERNKSKVHVLIMLSGISGFQISKLNLAAVCGLFSSLFSSVATSEPEVFFKFALDRHDGVHGRSTGANK